ncbi:hypothetical protein [Actinomadura sp. SCN-SB]|uniref:hypothetical protein n=1 Tax=Actinomadura sp. SCN-SB TaxID=3373092 RepID=UPI003751D859
MFRTLARLISDPELDDLSALPNAEAVFALHPHQLSRWLEQMWAGGGMARWPGQGFQDLALGDDQVVERLQVPAGLVDGTLQSGIRPPSPVPLPPGYVEAPPGHSALGVDIVPLPWDHLIYAYLVESTGIVEVLREVVRLYLSGERLGPPQVGTLAWALTTERLFFSGSPLLPAGGAASLLRPDGDVERRRAYWRMFGRDLPHQHRAGGDHLWKRDAGPTINTEFVPLMSELLQQVWRGIENDRNTAGANPTDGTRIAQLCQSLGEVLRMRRRGGMTSAEEFWAVAMLSWFHLSVESDTTVVSDLSARAGSGGNAADRLSAIAGRVGMAVPGIARSLFELADALSPVVWFIELGFFDDLSTAELLYRSRGMPSAVVADQMGRIVNLWQDAFGDPIKSLAVSARSSAVPSARPATAPPSSSGLPVPSANGAGPVGVR